MMYVVEYSKDADKTLAKWKTKVYLRGVISSKVHESAKR